MAAPSQTVRTLLAMQDMPVGKAFKLWVEAQLHRSLVDIVRFEFRPYVLEMSGMLAPQATSCTWFQAEFHDGTTSVGIFHNDVIAQGRLE